MGTIAKCKKCGNEGEVEYIKRCEMCNKLITKAYVKHGSRTYHRECWDSLTEEEQTLHKNNNVHEWQKQKTLSYCKDRIMELHEQKLPLGTILKLLKEEYGLKRIGINCLHKYYVETLMLTPNKCVTKCPICDKECNNTIALNAHMVNRHRDKLTKPNVFYNI